jgi:hypothetical protein
MLFLGTRNLHIETMRLYLHIAKLANSDKDIVGTRRHYILLQDQNIPKLRARDKPTQSHAILVGNCQHQGSPYMNERQL